MGFSNVGKVWTPESFLEYLKTIPVQNWKGICFHHTAEPSLAMRPKGLTIQHIENIKFGYVNTLKWHSGPHLFIDDDQIFGMCPLTEVGVHAVSFNRDFVGIEVLGDYDSEDPLSGRGLDCWNTAIAAGSALLDWMSKPINNETVKFHRDDPKTNKTCPGTKVSKEWVLKALGSPVHASEPQTWFLEHKGNTKPAFDVSGRSYIATRDGVRFLGGDDSKLEWVSTSVLEYAGRELEDSYIRNSQGFSPVREIVDALGLKIARIEGRTIVIE